ncbi:hypothetical protein BV20DRAFT_163033 [Pilatotrama ljubarskyi]|nr:hypothetical protein BV20DRAFT_163033 [Pilatotrama ljubarskyi]
MPRRSPPTPLRLHNGPLPARGKPKHTLPSLPRPAFHGPTPSITGPVPRARMVHTDLPAIAIPDVPAPGTAIPGLFTAAETASGPSSPTSSASSGSMSSGSEMGRKKSREIVRGPWDHSGAIHVPFDVGAVLPPPRPAAINVR